MVKNIIRTITLTIIAIVAIFSISYTLTHEARPEIEDCGEIVSKSDDEVRIKHGYRTNLYLNVQFEKNGFKSMQVNPTTYFKYQKGQRVCFDLYDESTPEYNWIICLLGYAFIILICAVAAFSFIYYLID